MFSILSIHLSSPCFFRNEQIAKLQQDLAHQKQDETMKAKKTQERNQSKQHEMQTALDKSQKDKDDSETKWKQKLDLTTKNLLAKQHELDVDNKRFVWTLVVDFGSKTVSNCQFEPLLV